MLWYSDTSVFIRLYCSSDLKSEPLTEQQDKGYAKALTWRGRRAK
ncbi:MAG TPA: hypothetical protein VI278_03930 [Nitrososphaeraceae archaeon]